MRGFSLFIDFDYTITTDDVGNRFYTYFSRGRNETVVGKWLNREITALECLNEEARLVRGTPALFAEYVDKFEIDPGFPEIVKICEDSKIPFFILSDGLDFYIKRILGRYGLDDLRIVCNIAHFENGGMRIEIPHWSDRCTSCGSCKGERIKELRGIGDKVIYIGDGLSDLCGAREADIIFAKDDLAALLKKESRDCVEYNNLFEVTDKLKTLLNSAAGRCTQQRG